MTAEIVHDNRKQIRHVLARTQLSNGYVISTIKRRDELKTIDEAIELTMNLFGVTAADLERPGELGMKGDYETMVFECDQEGEITNWQEKGFARYDTKEEAVAGHQDLVDKWLMM